MWWFGICVPFSPLKDDLLTSVRWVQAVFDTGGALAISGEGTIHVHEGDLLPFEEGPAYMALRGGVPLVPVAITGTSWARFRGRVQVRIGEPIPTGERPTRQALASLHGARLARDPGDGRWRLATCRRRRAFGRWVTDLFNDWGPGGRAAAARAPRPESRGRARSRRSRRRILPAATERLDVAAGRGRRPCRLWHTRPR